MYEHIKELADGALELQNKDRMDAALREISALCSTPTLANAVETKSYSDGTTAIGTAPLPDQSPTQQENAATVEPAPAKAKAKKVGAK